MDRCEPRGLKMARRSFSQVNIGERGAPGLVMEKKEDRDLNPYASSVVPSSGDVHRPTVKRMWDEVALLIAAFVLGVSLYYFVAMTFGYFHRGIFPAGASGMGAVVLMMAMRFRQYRRGPALGTQPFVVNGQARMKRGIEQQVREQVEAKYAAAYRVAKWPRRWVLNWRVVRETRQRVAQHRSGLSKKSLF